MWPIGRAAGRVIAQHPELAKRWLQWRVQQVAGGRQADLPESHFTVAARVQGTPAAGTALLQPGGNTIRVRVGNLVNPNYGMASPSGLIGPVTVRSIPPPPNRVAKWPMF